ncbi:MAG: lactate dehydrogenase [Peptococcaceae bacterium]|nr:lactate dehydrogenase [Peptococcaceae bacterium]
MKFYEVNDKICASWEHLDLPELASVPPRVDAFLFARDPRTSRAHFLATEEALLYQIKEDAGWLSQTVLRTQAAIAKKAHPEPLPAIVNAKLAAGGITCCNVSHPRWQEILADAPETAARKRVHLLALGDVGSQVLVGLRLLGGDCISSIGTYDLDEKTTARWAFEANQILTPGAGPWPRVEVIDDAQLFACDVFIFCASAGVPPVDGSRIDVRMAQLEKNVAIIAAYARKARAANFRGLFCEVSDPVDPLAQAAWWASNLDADGRFDGLGLLPEQVQGYGLGVMNARASYYAARDARFTRFLAEGRCFGGHGRELVVADSIEHYDDACARALTQLAIDANQEMRALGFKPYVAPAYSSAVLPILQTLRGDWHYGSVFLGGSYMGVRNRYTADGQAHEILPLPEALMERLYESEASLRGIGHHLMHMKEGQRREG